METADLVTFTEEILNEKLNFLCIETSCLEHSSKYFSRGLVLYIHNSQCLEKCITMFLLANGTLILKLD